LTISPLTVWCRLTLTTDSKAIFLRLPNGHEVNFTTSPQYLQFSAAIMRLFFFVFCNSFSELCSQNLKKANFLKEFARKSPAQAVFIVSKEFEASKDWQV
jgi:hypothetical protein